MLELNLWFSSTTGFIYGNIHNKITRETQNIYRLLSIQDFCDESIKRKKMSLEGLDEFINDPNTDHKALYNWTKEGSLACWNTKSETAYVLYNNKNYALEINRTKMKFFKGQPDVYFRAPL